MKKFLKRITQSWFSVSDGLQIVFLVMEGILPVDFFNVWEERERVCSKKLPDKIFSLLIESGIKRKLLVLKEDANFSFFDFCKKFLSFEYKKGVVEQLVFAKANFKEGQFLYYLQKNEEGKYEGVVYQKI